MCAIRISMIRSGLLVYVVNMFRYPVSAAEWKSAGPNLLKSRVVAPLFNQTYPGCWLGDKFYMVGDRWSPSVDPHGVLLCVKCQCAQVVKQRIVQMEGRVLCSNIKQECPTPKCDSPMRKPTTCCKVCPGQESSFEDQFNTMEYPVSYKPTLTETKHHTADLSALLVGGGRLKYGGRLVRTRAVAMVHITNITDESFNYAIRISRLKRPLFFKITDEYGNTVIARKISKQQSGASRIYDQVVDIPRNYVKYILHDHAYVTITTSRHRKGEVYGRLRVNSLAAVASFEALLSPPVRSGIGALVSMFYDISTRMMSFVIHIDGFRHSKILSDEYFVTFEKDTEIVYQHVLRISHQKHRIVGKVRVDSKMSKQIARGRLHVRVTSRSGDTMMGVLRPRLLRADLIGVYRSTRDDTAGFVMLSLDEDGGLHYKVSFHIPNGASITTALQRRLKNRMRWKDFSVLAGNVTGHLSSHVTAEGKFKKLRARDSVLIQNANIRIKFTVNGNHMYTRARTIYGDIKFMFTAPHIIIPTSSACDASAFIFYDVEKECSSLKYYVILSEARDEITNMAFTVETTHAGSITRKSTAPAGAITGMGAGVFRDLNHGEATIRLGISDNICDNFEGKIRIGNKCWVTHHAPTTPYSTGSAHGNGLEIDVRHTYRCYYDGTFYAHAQSWLPNVDNACVTCRCDRGNVYCDKVLCPPTSCQYPIKRDRECCHVCDDDNDTERRHLGSCYFEGDKRWHPVGTYWHPYIPPFGYSKCALCNCVQLTLEVNCTRVYCPELSCPKYEQVRIHTEDCCQVCRGTNDAAIRRTNNLLAGHSKVKRGCSFGGSLYQHGNKWHPVLQPFGEMKCYTCSCKNGKSRCRKEKCQRLDCIHQYRPSGECCPSCAEKKKNSRRKNYIDIFDVSLP